MSDTADFRLDPAEDVHARVLQRLRTEEIGWLGSTGRNGYPHAVPVWFLWHNDAILTFSQPHAAKARNLRADPRAMFHLESGLHGEHMQVLQGVAEFSDLDAAQWLDRVGDAYLAKYQAGLDRLGWTVRRLTDDYSLAIIVRPRKLIAW